MSTPIPRTSSAIIASGFQAVPEGFRAFAGILERELTALTTERDELRAELAAERARLDWLEENAKDIMKYNCRSYIWFAHQNIRAAIDAAMKEDAK
tara:strand:+ start:153 stop:440 length:288 start_codon:yes stop_codon:yes gene_type:complete